MSASVTDGERYGGRLPFRQVMVTISGIYTAQTLVSALTFQGLPAVLRANGVALDAIALVSVAMLPWALKFLWAPAIERFRLPTDGRRRSRRIVVIGEAIVGLSLIALSFAIPTSIAGVLLLLGIAAIASSTVDIACDAFAIEQLSPGDRSWGNVAQVGGSYFGAVFGGGLFLVLVAHAGWSIATLSMAALVLAMAVPFAMTREPGRTDARDIAHRPNLGFAFARSEVRLGLLMTVIFDVGARLAMGVAGPFLIDAGVDLAVLGWANGFGGALAGIAGTFVGGGLVRFLGTRRGVLVAAMLQLVPLLLLAWSAWAGIKLHEWLIALTMAQAVTMAIGYVALYSHLMGLASLSQAGVDFTLFQCANAAVAMICGFGGNMVAQHFGYAGCFAIAAAMAGATTVIIPLVNQRLSKVAQAVTA